MRPLTRFFGALAIAVASTTVQAESTFSLTSLTPDVAMKLATAARQSFNDQGY